MSLNITEIIHKIEVKQDPPNRVEIASIGKQGPKGDRGYSAYQGAVLNGYTGTEAEWLESLKIKGDTGDSGPQGEEGLSAYEVAAENGYTGTEEEWLLSLVGPKGDKGDKGDTGEQGIQGEQGLTGAGVPEIAEGDGGKFLTIKEDETGYETRAFSGFPAATTSAAGLMSAADKTKVDWALTESDAIALIIALS